MTAHGKDASAGFPDIAAHEEEIAQHLNREHTRPVLGEAHAVAGNHGLRVGVDLSGRFNRLARKSRAALDLRPVEAAHRGFKGAIAVSVLSDEIDVEDPLA